MRSQEARLPACALCERSEELAESFGEELTCDIASAGTIDSHPLPSGRDCIVDRLEWVSLIGKLKTEWRLLWRDRIDDKVRAEGIADKDYSSLFVECGTVIVATRDYKPPDFVEILEKHKPAEVDNAIPPHPSVGGWGKFVRTVLAAQKRFTRRSRLAPTKPKRDENQPQKKGGRGWLHFRMR